MVRSHHGIGGEKKKKKLFCPVIVCEFCQLKRGLADVSIQERETPNKREMKRIVLYKIEAISYKIYIYYAESDTMSLLLNWVDLRMDF